MAYIKNYPRPQFVREDWVDLIGKWQFSFDDNNLGENEKWFSNFHASNEITVPFSYETPASGIADEIFHPVVWYSKIITNNAPIGKNTLIHFEGSDYITKIWVNGVFAGQHQGGYTRFSFDITKLLKDGKNNITVRVQDFNDTQQPRGKQRWQKENFACWYVQTTGIWKPVWLEYINPLHIENVKMTPCIDNASIEVEWKLNTPVVYDNLELAAIVYFEGKHVATHKNSVKSQRGKFSVNLFSEELSCWGLKVWTPETPELYDISFMLTKDMDIIDKVDSYFGMREIAIENGQILLNGRPYYQRLILDQGYWENSHLTPPNEDALIEDIEKIKEMGFNGARKHQKVEDERWYYWCDVKGLLVWSEMPSPYTFGDDMIDNFVNEWQQVVKMHYNHPSVVVWTPINESWGIPQVYNNKMQQHFSQAVYYLTKSIDKMRPVIVNDGWEHTVSDIITLHDYEESGTIFYERYINNLDEILNSEIYHNNHKPAFAKGYKYNGQPILISEYGGAAYSNKSDKQWGYGNSVQNEEELLSRINDITTAIRKLPYCCGYCYTQITDVQQEVNGLLDINRNYKADKDVLYKIFSQNEIPDYRKEKL